MASWSAKRRINIILLILGSISSFIVVPYYLTHIEQPTCFDGKQNQSEQGIDCGGECALVCKGAAQDLKVLWKRVTEVRPGVTEAAFFLENANFNVGAQIIPYTVELLDANGKTIASRGGKTHAGSNEQFLVLEGNFRTGTAVAKDAHIVFGEFAWVAVAPQEETFTIVEKTLSGLETRPKLYAEVHNDNPLEERNVEVAVVISDDTANVVGYGKTLIDSIPGGETAPVVFTWPSPFVYEAASDTCDRPADVMLVFDRSGSMSSDGNNPPEPLTTAKAAASSFIEKLRFSDQVGVVSFATDVTNPIDQFLSSSKDKARDAMLSVGIGTDGLQYTNIGDALLAAERELKSIRRNDKAFPAIVLLTDGAPTHPKHPEDVNYPATYAQGVATRIKEGGIGLFAIGLGGELDGEFLKNLATSPAQYFAASSSADLVGVYGQIGSAICKKAPSVIQVIPRVENVHAI